MQQQTLSDYRLLAEKERAAAGAATLANVRQKHITAAETWEGLASRQERIAEMRAARALAK